MKAFYKVAVTKQPIGSAVRHVEPPLAGEVVIKVTDSNTRGDFKLVVIDCSEAQHADNLLLPGVAEVPEAEAVALAPKYQPKRTMTELNPRSGKQEKFTIPAADLKAFLGTTEAAPKPKRRTTKAAKAPAPQPEDT